MLVLTRQVGEKILIGDSIVIEVVKCERHQVRLAIAAPFEVAVDREELRRAKERGPRPGANP